MTEQTIAEPSVITEMEEKHFLDKPIWVLVKIQRFLLIITSSFLALSVACMAILRYAFEMNLMGLEEWVLLFGMWLYFVGAANGSYEKNQIYASVIDIFIQNKKVLDYIAWFVQFLSLCLFIVMCFYSAEFIRFSYTAGAETVVYKIPFWVGHSTVTINVFLMTFYTAVYFFRDSKKRIAAIKLEKQNKAVSGI